MSDTPDQCRRSGPRDRRRASAQGLRRDGRGRRRLVLDRPRRRPCAARRERRRQIHDREDAVRVSRSPTPASFACSANGAPVLAARRAALGVQTAFQEMTLIRDLTVSTTCCCPASRSTARHDPPRPGASAVAAHFDALGIGDVRLDDEIRDLDLAVRQKIEIARAMFRKPRILLLDEPTSTLSGRDVDWLGEIIADSGAERRHDHVHLASDAGGARPSASALTVLRNGRHIGTGAVAALPDDEIVRMIIGRSLSERLSAAPRATGEPPGPRCSAPSASRRPASCATSPSACARARFSASPDFKAWASSICSSGCFGMDRPDARAASESTASRS